MLEQLLRLAQKARTDHAIKPLVEACRRLLSERGQANVYDLALQVIEGYRALAPERARERTHSWCDAGNIEICKRLHRARAP